MQKERWDAFYRDETNGWGELDSQSLLRTHSAELAGTLVADVGAGDGREAMYLLEAGASVIAYDISQVGLDRLVQRAKAEGLSERLQVVVSDAASYQDWVPVDGVVLAYFLHMLELADGPAVVQRLQQHTKPGGMHFISSFLEPFGTEKRPMYYPSIAELYSQYAGWEVLAVREDERKTRMRDEHGQPVYKQAVQIVFRKPSE